MILLLSWNDIQHYPRLPHYIIAHINMAALQRPPSSLNWTWHMCIVLTYHNVCYNKVQYSEDPAWLEIQAAMPELRDVDEQSFLWMIHM